MVHRLRTKRLTTNEGGAVWHNNGTIGVRYVALPPSTMATWMVGYSLCVSTVYKRMVRLGLMELSAHTSGEKGANDG